MRTTAPGYKGGGWPVGADGLTEAERLTYRAMLDHQAEHGVESSLMGVMRALGVKSMGTMHRRVVRLVAKGLVERIDVGGRRSRYVARSPRNRIEATLTDAELAILDRAVEAWRRREGRPSPFGEALAGIVEDWLHSSSP